jgi:hypothetical protein
MERAAIQPEDTNLTLRIEIGYLDIEEGSRKKSKEKTIFYYFLLATCGVLVFLGQI